MIKLLVNMFSSFRIDKPKKHRAPKRKYFKCPACKSDRHTTRTCPKDLGILYVAEKKKRCRICKVECHNVRTCPDRNIVDLDEPAIEIEPDSNIDPVAENLRKKWLDIIHTAWVAEELSDVRHKTIFFHLLMCDYDDLKWWKDKMGRIGQQHYLNADGSPFTFANYLDHWWNQNKGLCVVCKEQLYGGREATWGQRMCVEHNHHTLVVRGLVCSYCNLLLGMSRESKLRLARAIAYLQEMGDYEALVHK